MQTHTASVIHTRLEAVLAVDLMQRQLWRPSLALDVDLTVIIATIVRYGSRPIAQTRSVIWFCHGTGSPKRPHGVDVEHREGERSAWQHDLQACRRRKCC